MRMDARRFPATRSMSGITLLEIMAVVVIMGIIATIVTKVVIDQVQEARGTATEVEMRNVMDTLELFFLANNFYPSSEQGLKALVEKPSSGRIPKKYPPNGYLNAVPKDKWGNDYIYRSPGSGRPYEIISYGRDGEEGGEGYDADIKSWELDRREE